jgi:hypothetical protein
VDFLNRSLMSDQFIAFWCKLYVIHYDNKKSGSNRLNITKKKKTLLTDSIYISADHAIQFRLPPDDGIISRNTH